MINEKIKKDVRQSNRIDPEDKSCDDRLFNRSKKEIFYDYCTWNGLVGSWSEDLLEVIEDLYNLEFDDYRAKIITSTKE